MLTFISIRCLNCNNVDEIPRMDYDEIPYCSQCAATSGLVPATPPTKPAQEWAGGDELANLFSRNLSLLDSAPPAAPLTPPGVSPTGINFSISQHYIQPTAFSPQTAGNPQKPTGEGSISTATDQERYIQYLLSSNLGSETSSNDLEIALAHGIIDRNTYSQALQTHNELLRRQQQEAESHMIQSQLLNEMQQRQLQPSSMALEEDCSAHSLLSATGRQKAQDPAFRTSDFFNDYYGGVDSSFVDDDEYAPCSVYGGQGSCHLRPFDL